MKRKDIALIKGFDRIAMVVAIIAIIPSFLIGMEVTKDKFRTLLPEYKAWEIKLENRKQWLTDNFKPTNHKIDQHDVKTIRNLHNAFMGFDSNDEEYRTIEAMKPRNKYKHPSNFECIIGSMIFALISFAVILFGIRGITRTIRWCYIGFKRK